MPRPRVSAGATVLAVLLTIAVPWAAYAADSADGSGAESSPDAGVIVVPYAGPGELRLGEGWSIDCDGVTALDGVTVSCAPDGLTLTADVYAPGSPEQLLAVPLISADVATTARFRVVLAPPAAPEIATPRVAGPVAAGEQALVPLSSLGIVCALCRDAPATVRIASVVPEAAFAGLSGTHLAVRSSAPGEVIVSLEVEDAAGQIATADVVVSVTDARPALHALHVVVPIGEEVDLTAFAWGDGLRFDCAGDAGRPAAVFVSCAPDGMATVTDATPGAQFAFRVVDADGAQARGSVTFAATGGPAPSTVSWADEASLAVLVAVPPTDGESDAGPPGLAPLALILQEVPVP